MSNVTENIGSMLRTRCSPFVKRYVVSMKKYSPVRVDFIVHVYCKKLVSRRLYFSFSEQGSASFNKFLTLLGDRVKLKGWEKFKAGLDVKSE